MRIGIIFTPDNAADRDFWRWAPPDVSLHFTRTPLGGLDEDNGHTWTPTDEELIDAVRTLILIEPRAVAFACTSGSFAGGLADERRIRVTMASAGAANPITTSAAVLDALHALGSSSVAVATPYGEGTTRRLGAYLQSAGIAARSLVNEEPRAGTGLSDMTQDELAQLALRADRPDADVLFISCTALETFDLITRLEAQTGKPVITSPQVTMWAALGAAGCRTTVARQSLLECPWAPSPLRA